MTYHHPGVPSAVRWCERVPCWQGLLRWQHWTLKRGGTHTNTARFWTLSSDTIAHWWLMITHTLTRWRWWRDAPPHAKLCFLLLFSAGSGSKNRYDNLFFFCFRGALASLPENLINFHSLTIFQVERIYCALFLKNVTLLWNFRTLHTFNIPTLCTFCMANSISQTRNFRPLFSWVAITWLLDSRGALTPTQDYPTGTIAVG